MNRNAKRVMQAATRVFGGSVCSHSFNELAVAARLDIGFVVYDLYAIAKRGATKTNLNEHAQTFLLTS